MRSALNLLNAALIGVLVVAALAVPAVRADLMTGTEQKAMID